MIEWFRDNNIDFNSKMFYLVFYFRILVLGYSNYYVLKKKFVLYLYEILW